MVTPKYLLGSIVGSDLERNRQVLDTIVREIGRANIALEVWCVIGAGEVVQPLPWLRCRNFSARVGGRPHRSSRFG